MYSSWLIETEDVAAAHFWNAVRDGAGVQIVEALDQGNLSLDNVSIEEVARVAPPQNAAPILHIIRPHLKLETFH